MALTQRFRQFFHPDIALDVGTANTRIHVRDKGVVLNEASVICIGQPGQTQRKADAPQSVGAEAKRIWDACPVTSKVSGRSKAASSRISRKPSG